MDIDLFLSLILLLIFARLFGELMERFGQSAVIGEIFAGILVGPSILGSIFPQYCIHPTTPGLSVIVDLAIFFLIFDAGLELSTTDMKHALYGGSIFVGVCGFVVAFTMGAIVSSFFVGTLLKSLFIGLCLALTALPIGVRILQDLGRLNTKLGKTIITSAIFDDIIGIAVLVLLLGTSVNEPIGAQIMDIGWIIVKVFALVAVVIIIEKALKFRYGLPSHYIMHYIRKFHSKEATFTIPLAFVLGFSILAALLGLHFIIGAFYGALIVSKDWIGDKAFKNVKQVSTAITFGFLAPIFLAYIGLWFNISSLANYTFFAAIIVVGILGKVIGGFVGAKLANFSNSESTLIGFGLNPRGIVEIIIALIGLQNNIINELEFSILVSMSIISTMMTPIILKKLFKKVDVGDTESSDKKIPQEMFP
ncbi:MAG: cation:proton antiporter [Thermoplasmata archaeon]